MRKYIVSAMVLLLSGWSLRAQATAPSKISDVRNTSYERDGQRVLRHEAVIPAPCSEVWKTLTTEERLRTFNTPVVEFELKTGGKYQTNYRVGSRIGDPGTIYNTVLSFVPKKMLSFKIGLTDEFPMEPREAGTLLAVIELEPVDKSHTNVAISMPAFRNLLSRVASGAPCRIVTSK